MTGRKFPFFSLIAIFLLICAFWWGIVKVKNFIQTRQGAKKPVVITPLEELNITLLEGWTEDEIAAYLENKDIVKAEDFISAQEQFTESDFAFIGEIPKGKNLEGFLFPDTYRILKGATAEEIMQKLLENFQKKLSLATSDVEELDGRYIIPGFENIKIKGQTGMSLYEVLTLASIVEREAGSSGDKQALDEERKIVAGIFYNRLSIGQALESDATINYVTKGGRASPTLKDLEVNSPYNTYKNPGLPPGPIGNPSLSSIMAVLHPKKTGYFYFLHKQPSGEPVYSTTFEEHVSNKFKYLK